jgi:glycine cleavage system H protein
MFSGMNGRISRYNSKNFLKSRVYIPSFIIFAIQNQNNMSYPSNIRYTKDHEWIKIEGDIATIGITDFAQKELGDIVYVEVETIGKDLDAGTVFGTVEAVKTVSDLYLPLSGTITELNPALASAPELVNTDPYGEGWMVKMKVNNTADYDTLLDAAAYEAVVA